MSGDSVCTLQAKGVAKKFQQSTPKGAPTKPQPLQKAGPLEAAKVQSLQYMLHHNKSVAIIDNAPVMIATHLLWSMLLTPWKHIVHLGVRAHGQQRYLIVLAQAGCC